VRSSTRLRYFLPVVIALSIMLASCTNLPSLRSPTTTSAPAAAPPPPAQLCGGPTTPAQSFWLAAPGGAQLYAAVAGTGPVTAVFVQEFGPRGLCGFWPYADWLARTKGVRSLLFSQCGAGASQCPPGDAADQWLEVTTAAVSWARTHDAGPLTLVGASAGGIVALQVAASVSPPVLGWWTCRGGGAGWGWTRWRPPGAYRCRRCSPSLRVTAWSGWARCGGSMRPLRSGPSGWWC
jgi:hypothetical protein